MHIPQLHIEPTPVNITVIAILICLVFNFVVGLILCYQQAKTEWDKRRLGELERYIKDTRKKDEPTH
jgi:hypothetical protein